jgi:RNA polymerase sigma factor (TIGR02999 family)
LISVHELYLVRRNDMLNNKAKNEVTQVLQALGSGQTSEELLPLVYNELRQLAAARMAHQSSGKTLQATALVHEAWLKLFDGNVKVWENRTHFFRAAAQAMRQILMDRARQKMSLKRGARPIYVSIEDIDIADELPEERVLLIDEALQRLQNKDPELAQVVMLKFFAGLTNAEVAETNGVTERTIQNKWTFAKAWLIKNIEEELNRPQ